MGVRHPQGLASGELSPSGVERRSRVPGRRRVGQGDETTGQGEVPQADGVPEEPGEWPGADQYPWGADQSDVPLAGEGEVQMAGPSDAGAVRGVDAGWNLEGVDAGPDDNERKSKSARGRQIATPIRPTVKARRMRSRWCSARSLPLYPGNVARRDGARPRAGASKSSEIHGELAAYSSRLMLH